LRELPAGSLIPVIMATALHEAEDKAAAADAGADDFISKPLDKFEVLTRVRSLLRIKRLTDALDGAENTILSLAIALEARDPYTRGHSERVGLYGSRLAAEAGFSHGDQDAMLLAGRLHDVGKIGVCEGTLQHAGPLDETQWCEMRQHPTIGAKICRPLHSLQSQLPAIEHHHEHWDGRGYPHALQRDSIPIGARITAICDAWDAMTSNRVYRDAMPAQWALQTLHQGAGSQWDPDLVELFTDHWQDITAPAERETPSALAS